MSLGIVKTIRVDFSETETYEYISAFSGEIDSRSVEIVPLNNGVDFVLQEGTTARLEARKSDNKKILLDCDIDFEKNRIYFKLTRAALDTSGVVSCQIGLYGSENQFLASSYFYINTTRGVLSSENSCGCEEDDVESSDDYQSFRVALLSVDEVQKRANAAIEEINQNAENADQATKDAISATKDAREVIREVSSELEETRNLNKIVSESEKNREDAETNRISNEALRVSAENSRISAEEKRVIEESKRVLSEERRSSKEIDRENSEAGRIAAESNRESKETARANAEIKRAVAENARAQAETERAAAELLRMANETDRRSSESVRVSAEASRIGAENARDAAEGLRANAEKERASEEIDRQDAEAKRILAETERAKSETERVLSENRRVSAENERVSAEAARAAAEAERVLAESERAANYTGFDSRIAGNAARISENAARVSANRKRIINLEQRMDPTLFVTDDSVAYQKDVPENAMPYAAIEEIGGMTRKCDNLIPFPYEDSSKEIAGVVWTVNDDGSVTAKGTATEDSFFNLHKGTAYNTVQVNALNEPKTANGLTFADCYYQASNSVTFLYVPSGRTVDRTFYPMINEGETALPYEPYFAGLLDAKVTEIKSVGVNLLPFPYKDPSMVSHGITWTVNDDGSVTANGTATANSFFHYTGNDFYMNTDSAVYAMTVPRTVNGFTYRDMYYQANVRCAMTFISEGETVNNKTFYPMINKGETALPYRPYTKNSFPIPEEVQAIDGYGGGLNAEYYNKLVLDPANGVKKFEKTTERIVFDGTESWVKSDEPMEDDHFRYDCVLNQAGAKDIVVLCTHGAANNFDAWVEPSGDKTVLYCRIQSNFETVDAMKAYLAEQYAADNPVTIAYALADPVETDVSEYFTDDNFIGVESGGTLTAVNEHRYDVPFTVEYMTKEASE